VHGGIERRLRAETEPLRVERLGPGGATVKVIPQPTEARGRALLIV